MLCLLYLFSSTSLDCASTEDPVGKSFWSPDECSQDKIVSASMPSHGCFLHLLALLWYDLHQYLRAFGPRTNARKTISFQRPCPRTDASFTYSLSCGMSYNVLELSHCFTRRVPRRFPRINCIETPDRVWRFAVSKSQGRCSKDRTMNLARWRVHPSVRHIQSANEADSTEVM